MIKKWLEKRKKKENLQDQERGFRYALMCFFWYKESIQQIEAHQEYALIFGNQNHFERGMGQALKIIKRYNYFEEKKNDQ